MPLRYVLITLLAMPFLLMPFRAADERFIMALFFATLVYAIRHCLLLTIRHDAADDGFFSPRFSYAIRRHDVTLFEHAADIIAAATMLTLLISLMRVAAITLRC